MKQPKFKRGTPDYIFLLYISLITIIGFIMVFSTTSTLGLKSGDAFYYVKRDILYILAGIAAMIYGVNMDYKKLQKNSLIIFVFSLFCLLLVFIPKVGITMGGASRWINLGLFSFQPSEIAKISTIIFLANMIANKRSKMKDFVYGLLPVMFITALVCLLVLKEPDLGTAIVIFIISFIMSFIGGARISHLLAILTAAIAVVIPASIFSPYRRRRLLSFIDPWSDPLNVGFHIIQSLLAVGSGGLFGLGLGASRQKFFYLPQQYTDFIFAILCEELGFVGATVTIILFVAFVLRAVKIIRNAPDQFSMLLCCGITAWITVQAIINMSVVVGIIPITGIPLPLISYGGTSLVLTLFALSLMLNISSYKEVK